MSQPDHLRLLILQTWTSGSEAIPYMIFLPSALSNQSRQQKPTANVFFPILMTSGSASVNTKGVLGLCQVPLGRLQSLFHGCSKAAYDSVLLNNSWMAKDYWRKQECIEIFKGHLVQRLVHRSSWSNAAFQKFYCKLANGGCFGKAVLGVE